MAWNLSKAKRRALVKLQLRDKNGRFIEMGGGVKWYSSKLGKEVGGTVVDGKGQNAIVQMNDEHGKPMAGPPIPVPAHMIEVVDAKASLDLPAKPSAADTPEFEKPGVVGKVKNALTGKFDFEGAKLSDVDVADMDKMPEGTILTSTKHNGHFIKGKDAVWQQKLTNGGSGALSTSASIKNYDGFSDWQFAKAGTDPKDVKASVDAPEAAPAASPEAPNAPEATAGMPNPKDDPNHAETMDKYALPEDAHKPYLGVSKTADGNTYITAPEGVELYTPAKELAIGDEVIAPDGAHPQKPFSMGKGWAYKSAERVNTEGPKIGKVLSIKEHAYAVVQLPEGETVESTQKPGEQVNTVTIGLSNKVIKATPELKEALKDVIPEPTYAAPEAPATPEVDEATAKRLDMLKKAPAGSTVTAKDGSQKFTKNDQGIWEAADGSETTPEAIADTVGKANEAQPAGYGSAYTIDMTTNTNAGGEGDSQPAPEKSYAELSGQLWQEKLAEEPTFKYGFAGKDEEFGGFDGYNGAEKMALEDYVGSSVMANSALRLGGDVSSTTAQTISGMDSLMERSVLTGDAKVYRGVGANKAMLDAILGKGIMRDRAFTSTSVDKAFADSWVANTGSGGITPIVMEINLPKGFKAHKVDYMAVGPGFDHENEVVLPRGLEFDITDVQEYTNDSGQKGYRVQASPILNEKNYDQTIGASNDSGSTADPAGDAGNSSAPEAPAQADSAPEAPAGDGSEQGQQVHDNAGSGGDSESGGSGDASPAEPSPEADADNGSGGSVTPPADEAPAPSPRRDRETIMSELQPMDTSNWKKVGSQAGSNPGGVFEDDKGQKWYVKQSKSEAHARAEVLSDQLYKAAGIDASGLKLTTFNGKMGTASPMIDGAKNDLGHKYSDKAYMDKVREGFAVDAWLANWDVLGLEDDNIVTDANGNPVRIDTGGTMMFRAQGGIKNDQQPGAWGNDVKDWDGLRTKGTAKKVFGSMTDQQMADSAKRVEAVTPEEIDAMVDALGFKEPDASELKSTLKARRDDIIKKAGLDAQPAQSENSDAAPAAADEPFEPALPSATKKAPEKVTYPMATKENPNVLQGYTIEKNADGVYFPKERLSPSAANGLRKGTIVPPSLPFISKDTKSGDVHYWDTKGVRHWGQYGGAGALTRRKNDKGEFEYLLAQRSADLSTNPNKWALPGGAHKYKSDAQGNGITAKIELEEELGMKVHGEPVAGYKHQTAPDWAYDYSIFDAPEGVEPNWDDVDKKEIQDLKWMTAAEIKKLRDDNQLQSDMGEVLDDLLKASESVEKDAPETTTPEADSDAPEAPSVDAEEAKTPEAPAAEAEKAPEAPSQELPTVEVEGPSAVMSDGKPAYVGSRVAHEQFGYGTVIQIIAGKSAKIEFDDGIVKISQAHKISSHDKVANPNAVVDTSALTPGEAGNNPANGKLFIAGSDKTPIYQGDKVEAMHQGELRTGVVKGLYKTNNALAIIFDGETKPSTKKAAIVKSLEEAPAAPNAPEADSNGSSAPEAPKYNDAGFTADEQKQVDALEASLSKGWTADAGDKLDELYAKGDARLAGKDVPEDDAPEAPADATPEPEKAPESLVEPDAAPETPAEPEKAPEEAPEAAPASDELDSKLDSMLHYGPGADPADVAMAKEALKNLFKDNPEALGDLVDETLATPEEAPAVAGKLKAVDAPEGSVIDTGEGSVFTKNADGEWDLAVKGKKFGIKATDEQIDEMSDRLRADITQPKSAELLAAEKTIDDLHAQIAKDLAEVDALIEAAESPALAKAKADNPEWDDLAEWEKELLTAVAQDKLDSKTDNSAEADTPVPAYTEPEELADWEKELLNGGSDDGVVNLDNLSDEQKKALGFEPETVQEPFVPTPEQKADAQEAVKNAESSADGGMVNLDDLTDEQKKALGFVPEGPEQPLNPEQYVAPNGAKYIKPATVPQDAWDNYAGWEKELVGQLDGLPKNNYNDVEGTELVAPSGAILDELFTGAEIVTSDENLDVWKKIETGATGYGDGIWEDQNGEKASSEEIANGADVKVISQGQLPPNDDEYDTDDGSASEIQEMLAKVSALPMGTKLGNYPNDDYIQKTGDDEWTSFFGEGMTDDEQMTDKEVADFADSYSDYSPDKASLPEKEPTANELKQAEFAKKLSEFPEGTLVGDPESGNYVKQNGEWVPYIGKAKVGWEDIEPNETMAQIIFWNKNLFDIDNPILPDAAPETTEKKSQMQIQQDLAKLPQGTKLGNPYGVQWEKTGPDEWSDYFQGQFQGSQKYTDWDVAELVGELPDEYGTHTFVTPEGATPDATPEPTAVGTLGGLDKAAFDKKPVGTKVVYSSTGKASEPTGVYEKTGSSEWSYTKEGQENPSKTNLDGSIFDHLFSPDVDNSKYSIDNKRSVGVEAVEPEDESGVVKGFELSNSMAALENFPVGTTIKKHQPESYYHSNNIYFVKQEDGGWQEYKKTPSKTMKGQVWSNSLMSGYGGLATISKPTTSNHSVLATGEIAYVGDKVYDGPDEYTVESILKTGINAVGADGVKKKLKPHALKKDSAFGVGPSSNQSYYSNSADPLSTSSQEFAQKEHAKLVAKQEAEKLKQSLENFGGGTADEYDKQGLSMPSNPKPEIGNGLTVVDSGEPDTSDPLYGTPKPLMPAGEANYPPFTPPAPEPLPKWDSDAWLKKVEQRYLDNPHKAKATVQQSNKWTAIQSVLNGSKGELDNLVGSMYLDDDLRKEAKEGIEAQDHLNAPLKKKIVDDAKAAKDAYDIKKAEDLKDLTKATEQYHKDLDAWMKANPNPNAYKNVKKPDLSTQKFTGGEANWSQAPIGTHTAKSVLDSMREDNLLGSHGLSIATDSDQIEDLDVKVTKVLDKNGDPKFEFKFKLTGPHGAAFESALKADSKVTKDPNGIYPTNMVKDASTGLFKDAGKPTSSNYINSGTRYTYTDPMTGASVVFQRADHTKGLNVSSNNNTVKVHMPVDTTPEQYQQMLENLGIKKARPSTDGDLRVLAENKLLYLMGSSKNGVNVIDGNVNMTGEDRKKTLKEIEDKYGVTPDDLTFSTEPNGRVRFTLSEEKAEELAKKYNVSHFFHDVKGGHDSAERWVEMLSGKNPGMLSTYHRFTEGINKGGKSSWQDMGNGAGDYNYLTPKSPNGDVNNVGIFIKPTSVFKRTDFWANPGDGWGKKANSAAGDESSVAPYKLFDSKNNIGATQGIGYQGWQGGGVYEVLPKDSIPLTDWSHVVVPSSLHKDVIDALIAKGITEINGLPLDKFIIKPGQTPPVDLTVAGTA